MQSESVRMTTAAEAAFRVEYPNSRPRRSLVVVLDEASRHVLSEVADLPWNGARFFTFKGTEPVSSGLATLPVEAILKAADGNAVRLTDEILNADVVVMITSAGESAAAAAAVGNIAFVNNVMTTGLVLTAGHEADDASETLRNLRPYAAMLVVATGEDYIPAMLAALRA